MEGGYQSARPFAPGSEYAYSTAYEPVHDTQQITSSPQYYDEYGRPVYYVQQDYAKPHDYSQSTVMESHTKSDYNDLNLTPTAAAAETRHQKPHDRSPNILRWWYTEILACVASILAIVVQVIVLRKYDGMPEDSWPSKTLTLNGLIAILATACRGSLMVGVASALAQSRWTRFSHASQEKPYRLHDYVILDEASRGPWGGFRVLWRFKGILHMSCLGALITIASLAMSTCSQQVLTLRRDNVISQDTNLLNQLGQVIRAENINAIQATDPAGDFGYRRLSIAASLAIYDGFLSKSIPQFPMACPTGDCTWPVFPTLGVCGRCADVSSDLEHVQRDEGGPMDSNYYRLPSGASVGYYGGVGAKAFTVDPVGQGRMFKQEPGLAFLQTKNDTVIAQFTALGVTKGNSFGPEAALASECAIWFCVQARNITVRSGILNDSIVDEWVQYERRNDGDSDLVSKSVFVNVPKSFGSEPGGSGHEISVDSDGFRVLQTQMQDMLSGNISDASRSSDWIEGLYSSINDTAAWVDRLAQSMTNNIRQDGNVPSSSRFYRASVTTTQVSIQVRWEWLAVPAVLVFLSITYLAFEIVWTAASHARPWKADPMVPLFTTLDIDKDFLLAAAAGLHRPKGLDDELRKVKVRLNIDQDGRSQLSGMTDSHSGQEGYRRVSHL